MNLEGKLEWFGGNEDALAMYRMFIDLAHTWDDLVDKDKDVSEQKINNAFMICLVYLPMNKFYQAIQYAILPMWIAVVSAYQTANHYERTKDEHGIEIAHGLRYAVGNIITYAVHICVGPEQAANYMPEVWKQIMVERYDNYRKEHLNV
jgi:purine-cytosine permease-like protein